MRTKDLKRHTKALAFKLLFATGFTAFSAIAAHAQTNNKGVSIPQMMTGKREAADTLKVVDRTPDQKDLPDVLRALFHIKAAPQSDSVGMKPEISVVPALGYTLVSGLAVVLSGNVAFRTGPQSRISTVVGSVSYTMNKQLIIPILTNFWTKNNKYVFTGDLRYYKYPESTYGLGSNSDLNAEDPMDFSFFRFYETALRHVGGNWYAGLGYSIDNYWNITNEGPLNGAPSGYQAYGAQSRTVSSGFTVSTVHDSRDNAINPQKGWYSNMQYRTASTALGSTTNWQSLVIDLRKYMRFPAGSNNVLAFWSYNWFILHGRPPYLNLPSSSWDSNSATGRGYIQGRFRGAQMIYAETEYRFRITKNGLIGGVLFANAETVSGEPGTRLQKIQPAIGPGLRIKLNKTSRTNIAIDYGFGRQGSRGLFIDVGEIF